MSQKLPEKTNLGLLRITKEPCLRFSLDSSPFRAESREAGAVGQRDGLRPSSTSGSTLLLPTRPSPMGIDLPTSTGPPCCLSHSLDACLHSTITVGDSILSTCSVLVVNISLLTQYLLQKIFDELNSKHTSETYAIKALHKYDFSVF